MAHGKWPCFKGPVARVSPSLLNQFNHFRFVPRSLIRSFPPSPARRLANFVGMFAFVPGSICMIHRLASRTRTIPLYREQRAENSCSRRAGTRASAFVGNYGEKGWIDTNCFDTVPTFGQDSVNLSSHLSNGRITRITCAALNFLCCNEIWKLPIDLKDQSLPTLRALILSNDDSDF